MLDRGRQFYPRCIDLLVAKCPGMTGTVPEFLHLSRLTQKADNVPDFSLTLSSRAHRWHLLSQQKTYKPGRSEERSFWHCFKY